MNCDFFAELPERLIYEIADTREYTPFRGVMLAIKSSMFAMSLVNKRVYSCIRMFLKPKEIAATRCYIYEICGQKCVSAMYLDWVSDMYLGEISQQSDEKCGVYKYKIDRHHPEENLSEMLATYEIGYWSPISGSNPLLFAIAGRNLTAVDHLWNMVPRKINDALQLTIWRQECDKGDDKVFSDHGDSLETVLRKYFEYLEVTYKFKIDPRAELRSGTQQDIIYHHSILHAAAGRGFMELFVWAQGRGFEILIDQAVRCAVEYGQLDMVEMLMPFYPTGSEGVLEYAVMKKQWKIVDVMIKKYNRLIIPDTTEDAFWMAKPADLEYLLSLGDKVIYPTKWINVSWESLAVQGSFKAMQWIYEYNYERALAKKYSVFNFTDWGPKLFGSIMIAAQGELYLRTEIFMWLVEKGCQIDRIVNVKQYLGHKTRSVDLICQAIILRNFDILDWLLKHFKLLPGSLGLIYDYSAIEQAIEYDSVRIISYVSVEYLKWNISKILAGVVRKEARKVLEWLRSDCKSIDFSISEEKYLEAKIEMIKNEQR